jgi:hypothetical protein
VYATLVSFPGKPRGHRKKMPQRNAILFGGPQIAVFGKEREDRRIEIGKEAPVEGNTDVQRCHALADRPDVVLRPGVKTHIAERHTETLIFSSKVVLVYQSPVASDNDPVSLRFL